MQYRTEQMMADLVMPVTITLICVVVLAVAVLASDRGGIHALG